MKIEVFESCCCQASNLRELVRRANEGQGGGAEVIRFTDGLEAVKRGIIRTPALVIDGRLVCAGREPEYAEIVEWLEGKS